MNIAPVCFRPLAGCGLFRFLIAETPLGACFRPLAGCGLFLSALWDRANSEGFRPLAGCGLFLLRRMLWLWWGRFPSPCGVWVVSPQSCAHSNFDPFPSPCGVWVVSTICVKIDGRFIVSVPLRGVGCFRQRSRAASADSRSFRPLAGCGLFRQSCTFFLVQQEKELSTLLFYCIILADVYQ